MWIKSMNEITFHNSNKFDENLSIEAKKNLDPIYSGVKLFFYNLIIYNVIMTKD